MRTFRTTIHKVGPISDRLKPKKKWGGTFARTSSFSLGLTKRHSIAVFIDERFGTAKGAQRVRFLRKAGILAHCTSTMGHDLVIQSEPIGANEIGLVMYTVHGKAIAAGTGRIESNGAFRARLSTLYDGIRLNSPGCKFSVSAEASSGGDWGVAAQIEVEF
jgi:hypothetical protein